MSPVIPVKVTPPLHSPQEFKEWLAERLKDLPAMLKKQAY